MLNNFIEYDFKFILFILNRLANKLNQLKAIYGELLRKSNNIDDYSHLLRVVMQISELNLV